MVRTSRKYSISISTPTHSYMKYLYKYPESAYPYDQIVKNQSAAIAAGAGI